MPFPERQPTSDHEQLQAALHHVQHRLELNDENENQMERTSRRDRLLDQQDELLGELSSLDPPSDPLPPSKSTT